MKELYKITILASLTLGSLALAQTVQKFLTLSLNGSASSSKAVMIAGESYIPVKALKSLGIDATLSGDNLNLTNSKSITNATNQVQGGANQLNSTEGCANQLLFNGIWRMRVAKIEYTNHKEMAQDIVLSEDKGIQLTIEMRNGTNKPIGLKKTGASAARYTAGYYEALNNFSLIFSDGATINPLGSVAREVFIEHFENKVIQPGASVLFRLFFAYPEDMTAQAMNTTKATKLLINFDKEEFKQNNDSKGLNYAADPSFRINLTCSR